MKLDEVPDVLKEVEKALTSEELSPQAEAAVQKFLNLAEQLVAKQRGLLAEVQRLKELLEEKKRSKTTAANPATTPSNHSSEEQRGKREPPAPKPAADQRSQTTRHPTNQCKLGERLKPISAVWQFTDRRY